MLQLFQKKTIKEIAQQQLESNERELLDYEARTALSMKMTEYLRDNIRRLRQRVEAE